MERVCGFAVSHTSYAISRVRLLLPTEYSGLSVCQSVTIVSPAKTAEAIELPFGFRTVLGSRID